jgi:hypothetical protein
MQDICPFRGLCTRKANPVDLFRPPPFNSTAGGPFGASPVVTPLSGCTAAPDAGQGRRRERRKGASRLAPGINRQHKLEERPLPLHGLKMCRDSLQPSLMPGTLTHLAGFPAERLLPGRAHRLLKSLPCCGDDGKKNGKWHRAKGLRKIKRGPFFCPLP